jgi:hypothetical protein
MFTINTKINFWMNFMFFENEKNLFKNLQKNYFHILESLCEDIQNN